MKYRFLKYFLVITLPLCAGISFISSGWLTYLPLIYAFGFIPLIEFIAPPKGMNLTELEREVVRADRLYDYLIYSMVPIQVGMLIWFLFSVSEPLSNIDLGGRISAMGVLCGVFGINIAHELGHRPKKGEQQMAKLLLLTSLYMHFFIEHNRGHHKNVSTPEDPASARKWEVVCFFWVRSVLGCFIGAWQLEAQRLKRKKQRVFSFQNEMLSFQLIQAALLLSLGLVFSWSVMFYFFLAALMGALLLETVNYIEHYGLSRKKVNEHRYENVSPQHSWNSNHTVGRLLLFELSRHSDHHHQAAKPYQELDHIDTAPQMPTGYPGMMLLALVPPLWFFVMHRRISSMKNTQNKAVKFA